MAAYKTKCDVVLSRRSLFVSGLVCGATSALGAPRQFAQAKPAQEKPTTFSSDVNVVNVLATVRDKDGKLVTGLSKEDFELQDDGRPQKIAYFARQTDTPLTLGLLVDTSMSERRMIGTERDASETFFDNVLRPTSDKAFLIHFDSEVELLQDLTASREQLVKALGMLSAPQLKRAGDDSGQSDPGQSDPDRRRGSRGSGPHGTMLYDAVYLASGELMAKQAGRKAVLLLTDGEDRNSKTTLSEAITSAQRSDTIAYAIRVVDEDSHRGGFGGPGMGGGRHGGGGLGMPGGGGGGGWGGRGGGPRDENRVDGKKILQQMARETGGAYFEVGKKKTLDEIFKQMSEELRNQYSIGYTPDANSTPGYHKIQLATTKKGLIVQARDGYYTKG
jgi:VWFA-related protein